MLRQIQTRRSHGIPQSLLDRGQLAEDAVSAGNKRLTVPNVFFDKMKTKFGIPATTQMTNAKNTS